MAISIKQIVNSPVSSNCYVITVFGQNKCIIIDPGSENSGELILYLEKNNLFPEYILLTHEHFDHIWGVEAIRIKYNSKLICSSLCNLNIIEPKKNMSLFYNQVGFRVNSADILYEQINYKLLWNEFNIDFLKTPGHTDSSFSIHIHNNLFVGDLMILETRTVTKLPTGDKEKLSSSLNSIFDNFLDKKTRIYPGHGNPFYLKDVQPRMFL
jgi:hydroxyacylglutathione hydrolase